MPVRVLARAAVLALAGFLVTPQLLPAAGERPAGETIAPTAALAAIAAVRRQTACAAGTTVDDGRAHTHRGRRAIAIVGRAAGSVVDRAVYDLPAGRVVAYTCLANASTRQAGEEIASMGEISPRADSLVQAILPGIELTLEGIRRLREEGGEGVYYVASYAPPPGDFPFLRPPVVVTLNASTGRLFEFDIDPDWLDPAPPPRALISKKAAERIAAVALRTPELAREFGAGASVGRVFADDLFTVRPNGWLRFHPDDPAARARAAWVLMFLIEGGDAAGPHTLFVDAASGRVLGGGRGGDTGQAQP